MGYVGSAVPKIEYSPSSVDNGIEPTPFASISPTTAPTLMGTLDVGPNEGIPCPFEDAPPGLTSVGLVPRPGPWPPLDGERRTLLFSLSY